MRKKAASPVSRSTARHAPFFCSPIQWLAGLLLVLGLLTAHAAMAQTTLTQRLNLTARVWGLAKYRHPAVTACTRTWDEVLVSLLPRIEAATDDAAFDASITELLRQAGSVSGSAAVDQAPSWVRVAPLSAANKQTLANIAANRPTRQCYVAPWDVGQADFSRDNGFGGYPLDRNLRLLGAFRFWNDAEYFFGYKHLIGRDWGEVLDEYVLPIAQAQTLQSYAELMRKFTAELNDSHGYYYSAQIPSTSLSPPFRISWVQRKPIVVAILPEAGEVHVGDELIMIGDEPAADRISHMYTLSFGSNPIARLSNAIDMAVGGNSGARTYTLQRPDGTQYQSRTTVSAAYSNLLFDGTQPGWRKLPVTPERSCSIGVLDVGRYASRDRNALLSGLSDTDILLIDSRGYPSEAFFELSWTELFPRLLPANSAFAVHETPDYDNPGQYRSEPLTLGGSTPYYRGRVIVMANENTLSAAEFLTMMAQGRPGTLVIGSQTAGGDGEITKGLTLPGGITTLFSSNRVYYPDGRQSQRFGIVPDLHVAPTIAGLRAGQDEVLAAAADCRWVQSAPAPRRPRGGMYFNPERSGEGVEVHKIGDTYLGIGYSFDEQGLPEWLLSTSQVPGGVWDAPLDRVSRDRVATPVGRLRMDFQRGPYSPECAVSDQSDLAGRASLQWPPGDGSKTTCVQSLLYSDESPYSGNWAGPDAELGWGLSLHHTGSTLVVFLYAFDAQGRPRWALGTAPWSGGTGTISVPMHRVKGFCRSCTPLPQVVEAAGSITLSLPRPGPDVSAGNWADVDVSFHDGSRWLRQRMPLRRL
ncbi:MAG: hypothetical protein JNN30_13225 [Rhodanobacteraceae bacterium]|nr:hypothetical protein [Rhodanobacteraceae bacterium]